MIDHSTSSFMPQKASTPTKVINRNFTPLFSIIAGCSLLFLACQSLNPTKAKDESRIEPSSTYASDETSSLKPSEAHLAATIKVGEDIINRQGCSWLLHIDGPANQVLDPINLSQEFQRTNAKVWVKFRGMRRMNRCPEASPVWIEDIIFRAQ